MARMSEHITIRIPGGPQAKGRHRSRVAMRKDGRLGIRTYADPATVKYETLIKQHGMLAMRGRRIMLGAVHVYIVAYVSIPPSWPQWKRKAALARAIQPTSGKDWDNYGKVASDALNGIVWVDDAQIVHGVVDKLYGANPELVIYAHERPAPKTAAEWRAMQEKQDVTTPFIPGRFV